MEIIVKYFFRLITLPFFMGLVIVAALYGVLKRSVLFLRFGGEFIVYRYQENKMIANVFDELVSQRNWENK